MTRWFWICTVSMVVLLAALSPLTTHAQPRKSAAKSSAVSSSSKETSAAENEAGKKRPPVISPEREAAVLAFVDRNHPELGQLLVHLKENQPKEYERAIRELFRTSDRLVQIHERDAVQYDLEVKLWNTQSRVQLLTARLKMSDSEDLRRDLKAILGEQIDNRVALLKHERQRVADRLSRLDEDLQRLEDHREQAIDRQLTALTRSAADGGKRSKSPAKGAARRGSKQSAKTKTPKAGD